MATQQDVPSSSPTFEQLEKRLLLSVADPSSDASAALAGMLPTMSGSLAGPLGSAMPSLAQGLVPSSISPSAVQGVDAAKQGGAAAPAAPAGAEAVVSGASGKEAGSMYLVWDPDPDYFLADLSAVTVTWLVTTAPVDATVTSIEYRMWIGEEDAAEDDFYCADYLIAMSSQLHGRHRLQALSVFCMTS